jgi:transcriptional repressor NrdR
VICPFCEHNDDKVIDSRASEGGKVVRRRRECLKCHKRFTTYERVEESARLVVVKADGSHVPFNRENVLRGINAACGKRPVPEDAKQRIVDEVEEELHHEFEREVPSKIIGQKVMARLRELDEVAYVRFASEYFQFQSVGELVEELRGLDGRIRDVKDQTKLFEERVAESDDGAAPSPSSDGRRAKSARARARTGGG